MSDREWYATVDRWLDRLMLGGIVFVLWVVGILLLRAGFA